ncbi:unnamed protein product [Symbiodinium necroappetens]|uniref:Uncharacterized protein n=1 Tax=Symbiodinium necroappetens TaxID=1628268 RepID=A0A813A1X9_9DINO|nr:unnamed protein product [Symbiodinium necroappetens]
MWWKVVLVIKGLDRLIMELKLPPTDSYHQSNVFRHFAASKATCQDHWRFTVEEVEQKQFHNDLLRPKARRVTFLQVCGTICSWPMKPSRETNWSFSSSTTCRWDDHLGLTASRRALLAFCKCTTYVCFRDPRLGAHSAHCRWDKFKHPPGGQVEETGVASENR